MSPFVIPALALAWLALLTGSWLGWQLLRQNGRLLLRLEEAEKRLDELEFGEPEPQPNGAEELLRLATESCSSRREEAHTEGSAIVQSLVTSAATNRFSNRSLARSKIKRDGLKAGTPAPDFRLPRLDGRGDLALSELRGKPVLLIFSSPQCGPCNALAAELEEFHRKHSELKLVMISKGAPKENRAKVREHGLTFPVVLQQQWEISRCYAMFATPIAYLIDEAGIIAHDVAVGVEAIREILGPPEVLASA